ncbi:MAG: laccase domain-containing protein [Gemmatimonadota bacterium]|nr:MAG: laccase domain-containing protein [Gemmatimonadota bacterium]
MTSRTTVTNLSESPVGDPAVPRYEITEWRAEHGVVAGITGREGGFDIGLSSADAIDVVLGRWSALRESLKPGFSGLVVSRQVHGAEIATHLHPVDGLLIAEGLDGHATQLRGLVLGVTVADCVPVYLVDPNSRAVALLHAGWRGVAAGVLERGIDCLCGIGAAAPDDLLVHCGVGICGGCYEVGCEVYQAVTGRRVEGPALLDLRAALIERARALGVVDISVSGWCSAHDAEQFHSHRVSGGMAGRMLAYIGLPVT